MAKGRRNREIRQLADGDKSVARKMRKYMKYMKRRGVSVEWNQEK